MSYLLDTNVISEVRKPACDPSVSLWFEQAESAELYLSVLVVGEIRQGIERLRGRGDKRQAELFERWLGVLRAQFAGRIVPVTTPIADRWGKLNAVRRIPVVDGLLLATAIEHDLTLVTREARRYADAGAALLDPWGVQA